MKMMYKFIKSAVVVTINFHIFLESFHGRIDSPQDIS